MVLTGINDPQTASPARRPGSMRRTSSIDMVGADGGLRLRGRARDQRTRPDGGVEVVDEATLDVDLDATHRLASVVAAPDVDLAALAGEHVASGFRRTVREHIAPDIAGTVLGLLLDDLPVAAMISGYGRLYTGDISRAGPAMLETQRDICAGWRRDGTMMVAIAGTGEMPVPTGPEAPDLTAGDPDSWHGMTPLPPGAMRRQRLLDVGPGPHRVVVAMFRDLHADPTTGEVTILHEYSLTAGFDDDTGRLHDVRARPQVLPWPECPEATASASRLDGEAPSAVRDLVAGTFRGTSTCTHLNDLLRSLADVPALAG